MSQKENLQEHFLNIVRKNKTSLTLYLVSGVKLQGIVKAFDNFCLLLRRNGQSQIVYKHAIATILPNEAVNLQFGDNADTNNETDNNAKGQDKINSKPDKSNEDN